MIKKWDFWVGPSPERQGFNDISRVIILVLKTSVDIKRLPNFWQVSQDFTNVQDVIDNYETKVTNEFLDAGFRYKTVLDTIHEDTTGMLSIQTFLYYNPTGFSIIRSPSSKLLKPLQTMKELCLIFLTSWACIELSVRFDSQPHVYDWSPRLSFISLSS